MATTLDRPYRSTSERWGFPSSTTFGPGSLEDLRLTRWTDRHRNVWVRLAGTYRVYCGHGSTHFACIDEREHLNHLLLDHVIYEVEDVAEVLLQYGLDGTCHCDCPDPDQDDDTDTDTDTDTDYIYEEN